MREEVEDLKIFITGADEKKQRQLCWFVDQFEQYSHRTIHVYDWGMHPWIVKKLQKKAHVQVINPEIDDKDNLKGWFKKPWTLWKAATTMPYNKKVCWLDTDCQIIDESIDEIFDHTVPNKLSMTVDRPWTKRRGDLGKWHNSGVIVFEHIPSILKEWVNACKNNPIDGDQETLYAYINGDEIKRMNYIHDLPHRFNTLRLDFLDDIVDEDPVVVHHTGRKGDAMIQKMSHYPEDGSEIVDDETLKRLDEHEAETRKLAFKKLGIKEIEEEYYNV